MRRNFYSYTTYLTKFRDKILVNKEKLCNIIYSFIKHLTGVSPLNYEKSMDDFTIRIDKILLSSIATLLLLIHYRLSSEKDLQICFQMSCYQYHIHYEFLFWNFLDHHSQPLKNLLTLA